MVTVAPETPDWSLLENLSTIYTHAYARAERHDQTSGKKTVPGFLTLNINLKFKEVGLFLAVCLCVC